MTQAEKEITEVSYETLKEYNEMMNEMAIRMMEREKTTEERAEYLSNHYFR